MKDLIQEKTSEYFKDGNNCCQSMLLAARDILPYEFSEDVIAAGRFMGKGMASGNTCGALIASNMLLGLINSKEERKLEPKVAKELSDSFIQTFGTISCKELLSKQSQKERSNREGCREITKVTAGILVDILEKHS